MRGAAVLRVALAVLAALLLAAPAEAAVCRYDRPGPRLTQAERWLRHTISAREHFGMRSGRAFVRRVNADPAARRRGLILSFPMTRRERRYFDYRFRLQDSPAATRLDVYMARHPRVFGAPSIEDDYPRRPYMQVRVTRDLARHRAAIRRRFGLRFRIKRVRYTERKLDRIADSINYAALEAEGIHAVATGPSSEDVEIEATTSRPDAAAVVRRMYGPAVRLVVIAAEPTYLLCQPPRTYELDPDGRTLRFTYIHSGSVTPRHVEVVESEGEVRVGMVSEIPHGPITADARVHTLSVTLASPLGTRSVRSIQTGRAVPAKDPSE